MELCACQKEIRPFPLSAPTYPYPRWACLQESIHGPSVSCRDRGSHFLTSACSTLAAPPCNKHHETPSTCKAPSRPQGRKDAKCGLDPLMPVVWAQRTARACSKSYGRTQPLKLLEKASTQLLTCVVVFEPTCVRLCAWCQFSEQGDTGQAL